MSFKGSQAYDNDAFFEQYIARRKREESPNEIIETPVFLEKLGDVTGKHILDLGCGDARFGNELLQRGCDHFAGIDGSKNMVEAANKILAGTNGRVYHSPLESWDFEKHTYDVVMSRLVFHYIEDLQTIFDQVFKTLSDQGQFIFSVQHPVLTSSIESAAKSAKKSIWIVDDYFNTGQRIEPWIEEQVIKYHRTTADYFAMLKRSGFRIEDISECSPKPENFSSEEEYKRRKRIPLFLLFSCRK